MQISFFFFWILLTFPSFRSFFFNLFNVFQFLFIHYPFLFYVVSLFILLVYLFINLFIFISVMRLLSFLSLLSYFLSFILSLPFLSLFYSLSFLPLFTLPFSLHQDLPANIFLRGVKFTLYTHERPRPPPFLPSSPLFFPSFLLICIPPT